METFGNLFSRKLCFWRKSLQFWGEIYYLDNISVIFLQHFLKNFDDIFDHIPEKFGIFPALLNMCSFSVFTVKHLNLALSICKINPYKMVDTIWVKYRTWLFWNLRIEFMQKSLHPAIFKIRGGVEFKCLSVFSYCQIKE